MPCTRSTEDDVRKIQTLRGSQEFQTTIEARDIYHDPEHAFHADRIAIKKMAGQVSIMNNGCRKSLPLPFFGSDLHRRI